MPYHVTDKETGYKIWNSQTIKADATGRENRDEMRSHIDKLGQKQWNNWVNRNNAVFAWSTFERASRYAERFMAPAIVEFDCSGTAWCVQNFITEDIYREYSSDTEDDIIWNLVNQAQEWNGQRDNELEIWMQPESVGDIHGVYDQFGDPLE
jgi:hypothetical protein